MSEPQPQYDILDVTGALSLCTPGVRMVVVNAWAARNPDGNWQDHDHRIYHVLAIQARDNRRYYRLKSGQSARHVAPEHATLESLGWRYEGGMSHIEYDAIIFTEDYDICAASSSLTCGNEDYRIVVCPWPVAEDEERLAPIVAELRDRLRSRVEKAEQAESKGANGP
jgi:hypothetical protein